MLEQMPEGYTFILPDNIPTNGKVLNVQEAEQFLLQKLKKHEQRMKNLLFELAILYSKTGHLDTAKSYLDKFGNFCNTQIEKAHYLLSLGQIMEQKSDFNGAVFIYQQASAIEQVDKNDHYFINNNLGYSLNMLKRFIEAEPLCRKAIEIDPQRHNAYKNLGISLQGQNQLEEAARNFIQSARMNASDTRAANHFIDLATNHPEILKENPDLQVELENCKKAINFAKKLTNNYQEEIMKGLIKRRNDQNKN
jgi:tetratricopeptide (TPR) repeat protein